ncbi:TRAP transporter substrate-binding protein [Corynebacterium sp. 335C]
MTDGRRTGGARARRGLAAGVIAAATLTAACSSAGGHGAAEGETTLIMGDNFTLTHPMGVGGTKAFTESLAAEGPDAGLHLEYFGSGQLGKQWDMPTVVRTGVADIAVVSPSYVSSEMQLSSVGDLPGLVEDSCVASNALLDMMSPGGILYEEEFERLNLRPLWVGVIPSYEAMTSERKVEVPDDLRGMVLRSTGGPQDRVVDGVDAAGVAMPIGDLYEALTRGTVEGTVASPTSITPYGLEEVIGYSTRGANLGSFTSAYVINEDTWQSLTDEQRDLISRHAATAQETLCRELNASVARSADQMEESGVEFVDVTGHEAEWEALLEPARQSWVRDLESIGRPAGAVLDEFERALAANADHADPAVAREEGKEDGA